MSQDMLLETYKKEVRKVKNLEHKENFIHETKEVQRQERKHRRSYVWRNADMDRKKN